MRGLRLPVLLLAALLGIASALSAPGALAQKRGGTLVMIVQPEPPSLASYQNTSAPIGQVSAKIYDGLLEYDFNFKPLPSLAKSWTVSPDGKAITFKLQEEAQLAGFSAVPSVELSRLKGLPFIDVSTKGYEMISPIVLIELNTTRRPFDNQKVRQAVSYAIERKAIIDTVFFGYGKPATGPISSNSFSPCSRSTCLAKA